MSNESNNLVYFDNLQITHIRGAILEENHYYPFGLQMAGISSKALNNVVENKYKFNGGSEINSTFDVNIYETLFRGYDYQTGRSHQIDPLAEITPSWGAYAFVQNNPLLYSDPFGLDTIINNEIYQWDGGYMDEIIINMPSSGGGDGFFGFGWGTGTGQSSQQGNMFPMPGATASGGGNISQPNNGVWGKDSIGKKKDVLDKANIITNATGLSQGVQENIIALDKSLSNLKYTKGLKVVGKGLFWGQVAISGYKAGSALYNDDPNKWGVVGKSALDITIEAFAVWGGPVGWVVGGVYFVGDAADWWGDWGNIIGN